MVGKKFIYKIYTISGNNSTYITTWKDVIDYPEFEININNGMGECKLKLARKWTNFGETKDVKNGNLVKIYVKDRDTGDDDILLLASGFISGYTPKLSNNESEENIKITILGNGTKFNEAVLTVSGNASVNYYSQSPSSIFRNVVNNYNTTVSGAISFNTNIDEIGTVVSYNFNINTYKEVFNKLLELSPQDWYYYISPDDVVEFHPRKWSVDHKLVIGNHIAKIEPFKNIENIYNIIYFIGDGIQKRYRNTTSIILYGEKAKILQDQRVSDESSADIIANSFLLSHQNPEVKTRITVIDNNGDNSGRGYNIDNIKIGQAVSIIHPKIAFERTLWDDFKWNEAKWNGPIESVLSTPMRIVRLNYYGDKILLELSTRTVDVSKRIEDINRNLDKFIKDSLT